MMVWFHEHLVSRLVPIGRVGQHSANPNSGDVDAIMESMQVNGVYAGVMAQSSTGMILAGNHRYAALLGLGSEQIPVDWLDVSDEAAARILVVDNRTTRLGRDNEAELLALLKELADTEAGLVGTGFADEDLATLGQEETGFGVPEVSVGTFQVVADFSDESAANEALEYMMGRYDARMVFL